MIDTNGTVLGYYRLSTVIANTDFGAGGLEGFVFVVL